MTSGPRAEYAGDESVVRRPRLTSSLRSVCLGALPLLIALSTGCPTVDLGDQPEEAPLCDPGPDYFETTIWPQYLAPVEMERSCVGKAGCHRANDGRSALRLDVGEPIDFDSNYQVVRRFLNCSSPGASRLLTEPLAGAERHGGGDIFADASDPAVVAFEAWFAQ
jgi:hypothetical protein